MESKAFFIADDRNRFHASILRYYLGYWCFLAAIFFFLGGGGFPQQGSYFFQTCGKKTRLKLGWFFTVTKRWYLKKNPVCDKNSEGLDLCGFESSGMTKTVRVKHTETDDIQSKHPQKQIWRFGSLDVNIPFPSFLNLPKFMKQYHCVLWPDIYF